MCKNSIISFLLLIGMSGVLCAQSISVGARTGFSMYSIANDNLDNQKYTPSVTFSVPVEIALSPLFSVQPEFNFIAKGVAFKDEATDIRTSTKTSYLEMPVLAKVNLGTGIMQFNLFAGPSFGYAIDRRQTVNASTRNKDAEQVVINIVATDLDFVDKGDLTDNRFDVGGVIGAGISVGTNIKFVFDARISLDFNDNITIENAEPPNYSKTFNRGGSLTAGVMIPIN